MTALRAPPPPRPRRDEHRSSDHERGSGETADERAKSSTVSRPILNDWTCGLVGSPDQAVRDKCRDIVPELIIELL